MQLSDRFERAVDDERYRQDFMDAIADKGLPRYVRNLVYMYNQIFLGGNETMMRTSPSLPARLYIRGSRSDIEVYPASFNLDSSHIHQNLDDFLSTLEDHEYFHAREYSESPGIIALPAYNRIKVLWHGLFCSDFDDYVNSMKAQNNDAEQRALENQFANFPKRDCSVKYIVYNALRWADLHPDGREIVVELLGTEAKTLILQ